MNLSERIYNNIVPSLGQQFIDYAELHPDNYCIIVKVTKGMEVTILEYGVGEVFKYSVSNGAFESGEFRDIHFTLNGKKHWILSYDDHCILYKDYAPLNKVTSISNDTADNDDYPVDEFIDDFNRFMEQETLTEQAINY